MSSEIKHCPFCGSDHVELVCSGSAWFVQCNECEASGTGITDGEEDDTRKAIDAWNRPAEMYELLKLIDQEYDLSGSWMGNGCEHGFKPASECPNNSCKVAEIQRAFDRLVTPNA